MAEFNDFITTVEEYFPEVKRLLRPGQKRVYREMIAPYELVHVKQAIEHFSRQTDRFPQANEFGQVLLNFATGGKEREQEIDEREVPCETCGITSVEYYSNKQWKRFSDSGGLMFLYTQERWYAALCWACGGPPRLRHKLGVPEPMHRPHYKREDETPLGELRRAAMEEVFRVGVAGMLSSNDGRPSKVMECHAWERHAIQNTSTLGAASN